MSDEENKIDGSDPFDDGFDDIPDFGDDFLDGINNDGKRKPIESVTTGMLDGFGSSLRSRANQRRVISNALPDGYGKAFDEIDASLSSGRALYDSVSKKLRPAKENAKRLVRKTIKPAESYLPKNIISKLNEWTEPEETYSGPSTEDLRESNLEMTLGELFGAQIQRAAEEEAREDSKDIIDKIEDQIHHEENLSLLDKVRSGMERQISFQDSITSRFYRKHIELQYRQLWVAKDQLNLLGGYTKSSIDALTSIVKNTALPDFVKSHKSEIAKSVMAQRVYGSMTENAASYGRNFLEKFQSNLSTRLDSTLQSITDGINSAATAGDMTEGLDIDKANMAGSVAGELGTTAALDPLSKRLGQMLSKNKRLAQLGNDLSYYSDNKSEIIRERLQSAANIEARDDDGNVVNPGLLARAASLGASQLFSLMPGFSPNASFADRDVDSLTQEEAIYTKLTDRTITEIIPDNDLLLMKYNDYKLISTPCMVVRKALSFRQIFVVLPLFISLTVLLSCTVFDEIINCAIF